MISELLVKRQAETDDPAHRPESPHAFADLAEETEKAANRLRKIVGQMGRKVHNTDCDLRAGDMRVVLRRATVKLIEVKDVEITQRVLQQLADMELLLNFDEHHYQESYTSSCL